MTATTTPQPGRSARVAALVLVFAGAGGCRIDNPAYDGDSFASDSDSGTDSASTGTESDSATLGDTQGAQCDGDACLYLDPPPIACYEFEALGADVLVDGRQCDRDGSVSGVAPTQGVHGQGVVVGETSAISVPGGVWPELPSLSLTAWFALTDPPYDAPMRLLSKDGHFDLAIIPPDDPLTQSWRVTCAFVDNAITADAAVLYTDGKWHLVACSCLAPVDNPNVCAEVQLFVDGKLYPPAEIGLSKPLQNGSTTAIAPSFRGCLDSVQVWDRTLTADELGELFELASPAPCVP
ncbi:MAG: LamG-like jellyroll fold domain-containing protein [Nannocystaceae bacterium]